jgi:hypothetical protein
MPIKPITTGRAHSRPRLAHEPQLPELATVKRWHVMEARVEVSLLRRDAPTQPATVPRVRKMRRRQVALPVSAAPDRTVTVPPDSLELRFLQAGSARGSRRSHSGGEATWHAKLSAIFFSLADLRHGV